MSKEVFKDIPNYEGLYQVSNLGNVKSLDRFITCKNGVKKHVKGVILRKHTCINGYYTVGLCKESIQKTIRVHRLVAETFIKNKYNKRTVNHINGIKTDNRLDNLEWNTHKENLKHAVDNNLITNNYWLGIYNRGSSKKISVYSNDLQLIGIYPSTREFCRINKDFDHKSISRVLRNKRKSYKKLIFKYY